MTKVCIHATAGTTIPTLQIFLSAFLKRVDLLGGIVLSPADSWSTSDEQPSGSFTTGGAVISCSLPGSATELSGTLSAKVSTNGREDVSNDGHGDRSLIETLDSVQPHILGLIARVRRDITAVSFCSCKLLTQWWVFYSFVLARSLIFL